jgi:hypothetical protein
VKRKIKEDVVDSGEEVKLNKKDESKKVDSDR